MKHWKMKRWKHVVVLAGTLALGGVATAQNYTNPYTGRTFNNPTSSFLDTVIMNNMRTQQLFTSQMIASNSLRISFQRGGKTRKQSPHAQSPHAQSPRERAVADRFAKYRGTMFTPSGKPMMPAKLAASLVKEPGEKQRQMTALLTEMLAIYEQRSRQQNAPSNDLARTQAYCIAVNYSHYSGKDISMDHLAALRGKIRVALSSDAKFRALNNAKKQQLSETLIILTNFMDMGHTLSIEKKDEEGKRAYRQMAGMLLKAMLSVEPNRVMFTETGLVITQ
jgi:hypothetical protein